MSSHPNLSQRIQLKPQGSSQIPHHSKSRFFTGLHARTAKTRSVIEHFLRKNQGMVSLENAVPWILSSEGDKNGIPIKRKLMALDCQACLIYRSNYCFFSEKHQSASSGTIAIPPEKKQKRWEDNGEAKGNSSHATLSKAEEIEIVAEPESYDTTNTFRDNGQNHISTPHIKDSTGSGPSTVDSYSEDTRSEQSIQSPVSSRSSSCSREHSTIGASSHVLVFVSAKGNVQTVGIEFGQQGSNKFPGENSEASNNTNRSAASIINKDTRIEDDNSSQSQDSSITSNTEVQACAIKARRHDELESWIKDEVLRSDPEVAELVYIKARDKLEYVTPDDIEELQSPHKLSLLRLMELETFDLVQTSEDFTACAGTSSSGASSSSALSNSAQMTATSSSSSSVGQRGSMKDTLPDEKSNQLTKLQKSNAKSAISESSKARRFRCFHNALYPTIFSANQETPEKFRTCAGPGWRKMQHCQEHLSKCHSSQVKKPGPLQCSVCLEELLDGEELRSHMDSVDCTPRCLECNLEFTSKSLRLEHQKSCHSDEGSEGPYMDLNEKKKKEIKEALKAFKSYSDQLKKGRCEPKPELEDWILANTALYEEDRSDEAKTKTRMELGYWYTIFTTLAPHTKILEHPFYDTTTVSHGDMASERILLTNDMVVESKIRIHGPPPTDPDRQREWYRDSLREALQISARTTMKVTYNNPSVLSASTNILQSTQDSVFNSGQRSDLDIFTNDGSTVTPSPNIANEFSDVGLSPESYIPNTQSVDAVTGEPNSLSDSSMIGIDWAYDTDNIVPDTSQYQMSQLDQQYIDFGSGLPDQFENNERYSPW